jgi:hypothetical protein
MTSPRACVRHHRWTDRSNHAACPSHSMFAFRPPTRDIGRSFLLDERTEPYRLCRKAYSEGGCRKMQDSILHGDGDGKRRFAGDRSRTRPYNSGPSGKLRDRQNPVNQPLNDDPKSQKSRQAIGLVPTESSSALIQNILAWMIHAGSRQPFPPTYSPIATITTSGTHGTQSCTTAAD